MSLRLPEAILFAEASNVLAESPLWFEERWWWVDIEEGAVYSRDACGGQPWSHAFGQRVTALLPAENGRLIVIFERSLALWDRSSKSLQELAVLGADESPSNRFNDGKCDPVGRILVGTLNMAGVRGAAALYSFEFPGHLVRLLSGIHLSNGLAWSADGCTLYHVDSLAREIAAHDYDLETGRISRRRVVIRVPPEMGLPDGMDIDAQGQLWIAHWGGSAVRCWSPETGRCLAEIPVPCSQPTSCRFGGTHPGQILITTARAELSDNALTGQPLAGSIFVASTLPVSASITVN